MTSSFDISVGQSSFQAKTAEISKNLDSFTSIEMNYNLRKSSAGIAYCMSFFEVFNSKDGYMTFTRFSIGPRWYPRGMNGGRIILDNDVTAQIWKATPFIGINFGIANMSVKEFNASFTDLTPRMGVEMPLTAKILIVGEFMVASSLASSSSAATAASYSGVSAMIGLIASNLFD